MELNDDLNARLTQTTLFLTEQLRNCQAAAMECENGLFEELRKLRGQVLDLQQENVLLKSRAEDLGKDLEADASESQARMDELQTDRDLLKRDLSAIIAHLHTTESARATQDAEKDRMLKDLRLRCDQLETENGELKTTARTAKDTQDSLFRQLEMCRDKVQVLEGAVSERQKALEAVVAGFDHEAVSALSSSVAEILALVQANPAPAELGAVPSEVSEILTLMRTSLALGEKVPAEAAAPSPEDIERDAELVRNSGFFDEIWYMARYGDQIPEGETPAQHFVTDGGKRGFSPSAIFDAERYLRENLDLAQVGVNPLVHYILYGKDEGRAIFAVK